MKTGNRTLAGPVISTAALVLFFAGCKLIEMPDSPMDRYVDKYPPTVYSVSPADGSTDVARDTLITVVFSERMNAETVSVNTDDTVCSGSVQVSKDGFATCVRMADNAYTSNDSAFSYTPASNLDNGETYGIRLVETEDSGGNPLSEDFTSSFTVYNARPLADAGSDRSVHLGSTVTLDGSGSKDDDGNTLAYEWSIDSKPDGSSASLSDSTAEQPTFVADLLGTFGISLTVNDSFIDSTADTVTVTTYNTLPIADAGSDRAVILDSTVTLDGSGSADADGDTLTYYWSIDSKPDGSSASLSDSTAEQPTFVADLHGTYGISLTVNDSFIDSTADTIKIMTAITVDSATSLMWQDNGYETRHYWGSADDYCGSLELAGYSDWRLPDKDVLQGLYSRRHILESYGSSYYWSSATNAGGGNQAWCVGFLNGYLSSHHVSINYYVRCVRGGQ